MTIQRTTLRGMCCQCFPLPYSPEKVWEIYEHYILDRGLFPSEHEHNNVIDIEILAPMLNYIGYRPLTYVYPGIEKREGAGKLRHLYSCRHFDYKNGLCKIHEKRPHMCRIYEKCEYKKYCESWYCEYHPKHHRALQIKMEDLNLEEECVPKLTLGPHNLKEEKDNPTRKG